MEILLAGRLEHVQGLGIADEDGIETFTSDDFEAKTAGGIGLWVEIDEEDAPTGLGGSGG